MTAAELTAAREALGLKASELGRRLELTDRDPGRYVLKWEKGEHPVPGPVAVAVRYMLQEQAQADQDARAPAPEPVAFLEPPRPAVTTRRRQHGA
jgi:transcriptional regulator with XRE-family HTH domain